MLYPAELQALPATKVGDSSTGFQPLSSPHQSCPPLARAMPDSSETGETGGKSATRSSKHFSFQSSDRLTRPAFLACLASLAV